MTRAEALKGALKKRFPGLRRLFWRTWYGLVEFGKWYRWTRYDLKRFNRIHSHLVRLYASFVGNYFRLYHIRTRLARQNPRPQLIAISLIEHMGDIVACLPVADYVRQQNPDAYILWIVGRRYRELVAAHPALNETIQVQCLTEWLLLQNCHFFDEIIELHPDGRFCSTCWIRLNKTTGDRRVTIDNYYEFGKLQDSFCIGAGLPRLDRAPRLDIPASVAARIDRLNLPEKFIVVHTTSNESSRDWTPQRWHELVTRLLQAWDGSVVEVGLVSGLDLRRDPRVLDLCGKLSILETGEVIRRAEAFVGVDSGPAHLANAVNVPGVILLGQYRAFQRYMPYTGPYEQAARADLLYADGPAATIPVERVYAALARRLMPAYSNPFESQSPPVVLEN